MSIFANFTSLLLGHEPRQRLHVSQTLLVLVVYLVFAAVQHTEVLLGMMDERQSWALTAWNLCGGIGFYALVRTGASRPYVSDRWLAVAQQLWAMVGISWSYAITGPARGAVMLIMLLVVIYGMFSLTARQSRAVVAGGIAMLGTVMVGKALTDPARYDPRVEAFHGVFFVIVMSACAVLSIRIGRLRRNLQQQRTELAEALERIQALATRDDLTGLPNRRAALEGLKAEIHERRAAAPHIALALIDLDHFKRVNDQHGHAAGDRVLRRFAEIARGALRGTDVLARWGGEEFLLTMPGADVQHVLQALERVRQCLRATPLHDVAPGFVVSFSAGVAVCSTEGDLEKAIERADRSMYAAKRAGRDRAFGPEDCATLAIS